MKQLSQLLTLLFLFIHLNSKAQTDIQQDWRVDPVLKQVDSKHPGLKIYGRKDDRGRYVNMAVLNESTRKLKWFTCYGTAFDSVQLSNDKYNQVAAGTLDPFTFYRNYCYENLFYIEYAELLYRLRGKAALQDTSHNNRAVFDAAPVKSAQSTLQKLMAMEGLMKTLSLQLRLFDSRTPRQLAINRNDSNSIRQNFAGMMVRKADNTEYYNTDPLATAAKIVLYQQSPNRLFVYDQDGALMDSVPLKPGKYASLLKEKEDVFLLYRGWLELQWQQLADSKQQYARWLRKLDSSLYKSVSWEQKKLQLQNVAVSLQERQNSIDDKISSLIVPEERYVEQLVADFYRNETSEISYLSGLGFAYTISYIRGQKQYELGDHRRNVIAVVSDKKKGIDENSDGIIEYYNADVVHANDYYPFGMLQPGRSYNSENKYRYGYNAKENDNEVKGRGNLQDYGMRIYDPRIGRFLTVDPITADYPELTPYQFASNSPISGIDRDGLEFFGAGYLIDEAAKGLSKLGLNRTAGFVSSYGHSLVIDPIYSAHGVVKTAQQGDITGTLKQFDPTGLTSIPDIYKKGKEAAQGNTFAQGEILGMLPGLYGGFKGARAGGLKLSAELSPGTHTAGFSLSRGFSGLVRKVSEFKLVHLTETILKSDAYKQIQALSNAELIESVLRPKDGKKVTVNTRTGGVVDGNTRIYEMQRRGLNDIEIPFDEYTPDQSMFPDLQEPPKKE